MGNALAASGEIVSRNMEQLTDDMKAVLKAAYRAAPNGETFILERLPISRMSVQARKDCAFALSREDVRYLHRGN
jgi:hypothetical protein